MFGRRKRHTLDQPAVARQLSAWYAGSSGGARSAQALNDLMNEWLSDNFGHCALEVSALPEHGDWLRNSKFRSRFRLGAIRADVLADFEALPIDTESLDLVIACHALEFTEDPYRLLREIDRVLIPEGRCIIVAFNPFGLQGLMRPIKLFRGAPWCGHFYPLTRIKDWLSVLGFSVEKSDWVSPMFVVSGDNRWWKSVNFALTGSLFWMGGLSALYARKQVSRILPVSEKWRSRSFLKNKVAQPAALNPHDV